nr:aryl hydrocarbon receptor-like isoform X1 [Misgurnus anguillicaudatus]
MLANGGLYAVKNRKRPVHKSSGFKSEPENGSRLNPSKRHRERLNTELDQLTTLLPFTEEIRARLDKLSVLRLSVGYLKIKNYFTATLRKRSGSEFSSNAGDNETVTSIDGVHFSEGDLLLHALNGFVMVVSSDGFIFYASPTIQDYLGFHQSDVIHQSVFDLIHIDDRDTFRCQLHFALDPKFSTEAEQRGGRSVSAPESFIPPENSSFLERNFCCRLRCLLDNTSGFMVLNFQGRLKYIHRRDRTAEGDASGVSQLALFAIATPVHPPAILQIRPKTLFFQTKHRLDFTPVSMDTRGKMVLGYTEQELCMRGSGYQFIHAADMMYCADKHLRMMKTGESGFTIFRLLSKKQVWIWVQSNARMVFKAGKPDFIICRQKPLTNEEGEKHLCQRQLQLPFSFATGEAVLYETFPSMMTPGPDPSQTSLKSDTVHPDSLLGSLLSQDQSVYEQPVEPASPFSVDRIFMDSHALLSVPWSRDVLADGIRQDLTTTPQSQGSGDQEGLKEMERALLELLDARAEEPILANDVFSYVEEALLRESNSMNQINSGGNTIGQHEDYALPSNQMTRCQSSFSASRKLTQTFLYGSPGQTSFQHSFNHSFCSLLTTKAQTLYGPSHNSPSSSQFTDIVFSGPSQNCQHHRPPDVPERPIFINSQDPHHQGVLQPWQQQHHIPLTLPCGPQRSDCVQDDCIKVTQHPQDHHTQSEPHGSHRV